MRELNEQACVSDLVLDEHLAGELDPQAKAAVAQHLAQCQRCAARRDEREADRAAFLARAPSFGAYRERVKAGPGPRAARRPKVVRLRPWLAAAGVLAIAAAALLVVRSPGEVGIRSKGGARIGYYVKRGESVTRGHANDAVRPGDQLRFVYSTPEPRHLALLNLDERSASVYFPANEARAARVAAGTDVALDFSVELDELPGTERIHALFCAEALELEPVRARLEADRSLVAPDGCSLHVITLRKESR